MKYKYRILEKHYKDGSIWFMPQAGNWWHGWRYICRSHPCPDVKSQRAACKTFKEACECIRDFIKCDKGGMSSPAKSCITCITHQIDPLLLFSLDMKTHIYKD